MSTSKLLKAGFTDLVSVIPPGAELSPNSKIPPEGLGKTPGRRGRKGWYGYNFLTAARPNAKAAQQWDEWGANVGLRADHFPALDIDCDSPSLVKLVTTQAWDQLGAAPCRRSKGHRMLIPYRTDTPFPRMGLLITHKGSSHLVEFLGAKRQYLVHGTHPSGAEYRWDGDPLWKLKPEQLTPITGEQAEAFLDGLAEHLRSKGLEVERVGKKSLSSEPPPPQDHLLAPSIAKLREVVELTPNPATNGRDQYIEMGYAIKAAGQEDEEEAFEVWQEWADRWEGDGSEDPDADRRNWDRLHPPYRVGWPWIQERAQEAGEYISAQDEFEADPSLAPGALVGARAHRNPASTIPAQRLSEELLALLLGVGLLGLQSWARYGHMRPEDVEGSTSTIRSVLRFLEEHTEAAVEEMVPTRRLYSEFRGWCAKNGGQLCEEPEFRAAVVGHGAVEGYDAASRRIVYRGLRGNSKEQIQ